VLFLGVFFSCLFPFLTNDTHILNLTHVISLTFNQFASQLGSMGLFVQPYKCSVWALFSLLPGFITLIEFCCPPSGIKIFNPLWFNLLHLFLFVKGFRWGCSTCKCVLKIEGHPSDFWYFLLMFHSKAFLFALLLPPLLVFGVQFFVVFLFHLDGGFWKASGLIGVP